MYYQVMKKIENELKDVWDIETNLINELKIETDMIRKKNIYKEIVKCQNAKILYQYLNIYPTAITLALSELRYYFGDNNTFKDFVLNEIDYELNETERECLIVGLLMFNKEIDREVKFIYKLVKLCNKELKFYKNKYIKE